MPANVAGKFVADVAFYLFRRELVLLFGIGFQVGQHRK